MKKSILIIFALLLSLGCFAQNKSDRHIYVSSPSYQRFPSNTANARLVSKTDTGYYWNNPVVQLDTTGSYLLDQVLPADSGYWFGTNYYNFQGFAELYDINKSDTDTSIVVLGVVSAWHGHVQPISNNTLTFRMWNQDPKKYFQGDTDYIKGFPGTVLTSLSWPFSQLLIGAPGAPDTTPVVSFFSSAITNPPAEFFVGYEMSYNFNSLNGDTITLGATPEGNAHKVGMHYLDSATGDLIYIPRNAIEVAPGIWHDCYYNYGFQVNLGIVPIVQRKYSYEDLDVKMVTKNELTFFGNYPNPAKSSTNIKFALEQPTSVTIQIMNMNGQLVASLNEPMLNTGTHLINVSTANMPAGNYVYMLRTANGTAIASMLSVVK